MLEYNILNMEIASVAGPYSVLEFFHYKCKKCNSVMKSKVKLNFCQNCGIKYDIKVDILKNDIESLKETIVEMQKRIMKLESKTNHL